MLSQVETTSSLHAATRFARHLESLDTRFRDSGKALPDRGDLDFMLEKFVELRVEFASAADAVGDEHGINVPEIRSLLGPWLWRSRLWSEVYHKPFGYAGDFQVIEMLYDLEPTLGQSPDKPPLVNCLDFAIANLESAESLWERRHWIRDFLRKIWRRNGGRIRILDIASGGARYVQDFLESIPSADGVEAVLLDRDPVAVDFCRRRFSLWGDGIQCQRLSADTLADRKSGSYDVVVAAGLFDYLPSTRASKMASRMQGSCAPGGHVLLTNYNVADPTRRIKDWLMDWRLIYRNEEEVAAFFRGSAQADISLSKNGSLILASWIRDGE